MEEKQLKFVRLQNSTEDLIGYVTQYEEHIVIERPLLICVETYIEDNRQSLTLQEYIPQMIVDLQEIEIQLYDIGLIAPVRKEFIEQYESASEFFYLDKNKVITSGLKTDEERNTSADDKIEKVVSILEAMANKKDKQIH